MVTKWICKSCGGENSGGQVCGSCGYSRPEEKTESFSDSLGHNTDLTITPDEARALNTAFSDMQQSVTGINTPGWNTVEELLQTSQIPIDVTGLSSILPAIIAANSPDLHKIYERKRRRKIVYSIFVCLIVIVIFLLVLFCF